METIRPPTDEDPYEYEDLEPCAFCGKPTYNKYCSRACYIADLR